MIKDLLNLLLIRHKIKKERKIYGACQHCGKTQKCEPWCWGPKIHMHIRALIKGRSFPLMKFLWTNYKNELHWAGVEPWHRYE